MKLFKLINIWLIRIKKWLIRLILKLRLGDGCVMWTLGIRKLEGEKEQGVSRDFFWHLPSYYYISLCALHFCSLIIKTGYRVKGCRTCFHTCTLDGLLIKPFSAKKNDSSLFASAMIGMTLACRYVLIFILHG